MNERMNDNRDKNTNFNNICSLGLKFRNVIYTLNIVNKLHIEIFETCYSKIATGQLDVWISKTWHKNEYFCTFDRWFITKTHGTIKRTKTHNICSKYIKFYCDLYIQNCTAQRDMPVQDIYRLTFRRRIFLSNFSTPCI